MAENKATLKEVVNNALRRGLGGEPPLRRRKRRFRVVARSFGFKPGVDTGKLNQLVDELELQEFAAKGRKRRR